MAEKREPTACDGRLLKAEFNIQSAHNSAPAFQSQPLTDAKRVRLQYLATRLHALGERPLFEFLTELERDADMRPLLERYARLPAGFIAALGGDKVPPRLFVIDGGELMSGGRASRDKGNRAERALVRTLQAAGFGAERVPLSGSAGGSYLGDLTVALQGVDRVVEVKVRATGFSQLYAWLDGRDLLVVRADRREPLVVVPLSLAIEIATAAERTKGGDS